MAIQPFATQIQPPQIAAPQPVNQLAQFMQLRNAQQENQLRGMQMAEAQRGLDVRNALRGLDPTSEAYVSDVYRLDPELGSQIEQRKAATRASIISAQQGQLDNLSAKLKMVRDDILRVTNPDQLIGISRQVYSDPDLAPYFQQQGNSFESDVDMVARAVQAGPEAFENLIAQLGGGLDAKVKLEKDRADQRRLQEGERRAESEEGRKQRQFEQASDPQFQRDMTAARERGVLAAKNADTAQRTLPPAISQARETLTQLDALIGKRDDKGNLIKGSKPHPGFSAAVGFRIPYESSIPGTDAKDFTVRFEQVLGKAFLQAYETLKGGGQITQPEGEKATAAMNRMNLATSEKEFVDATLEFKSIVQNAINRNELRLSERSPSAGESLPAPKVGDVVDGYEFLGGDFNTPSNWREVGKKR